MDDVESDHHDTDPKTPAAKDNRSVKEHLAEWEQQYAIPDTDADVQNFQKNLRKLVHRLSSWARDASKDEHKEWFAKDQNIPLCAQQLFGNSKLKVLDLLALPNAESIGQPMVYIDVATLLASKDVVRQEHPTLPFRYSKTPVPGKTTLPGIKMAKRGVDIASTAMEAQAYLGSTTMTDNMRCRGHLRQGNLMDGTPSSQHYKYATQKDVAMNFRVAALWKTENSDNTNSRAMVLFCVAVLMTSLGLYLGEHSPRHSASSFDLNRRIRRRMDLPDLSDYSLVRGWPLFQGMSLFSEPNLDRRCANLDCGPVPTSFCQFDDHPGEWLCQLRHRYWRSHQRFRPRKIAANKKAEMDARKRASPCCPRTGRAVGSDTQPKFNSPAPGYAWIVISTIEPHTPVLLWKG